jgi:outer membrane protein assembly factor BamB
MQKRHQFLPFVILFVSALLLSGCEERGDWIKFRGENGLGTTSTSIRPPLAIKWKLQLQQKGDIAKFFNPPIIMDDTIYFGSYDGNFYALDIKSGYMRWHFETGNHINSIPCGDAANVYFGSDDGKLYAVARKTGKEVWHFNTGELVQSLVMKYKDMIVFVTNEGAGYFLDTNGELLFTIPNPNWSKYTFQIFKDTLYFAPSVSGYSGLSTFNVTTREYGWELDPAIMNAYWYSPEAVDDNRVYLSTATYFTDNLLFNFYALDRKDGRVLWQADTQSEWSKAARFSDTLELLDNYKELLDYMAPSVWRDLVVYIVGDTKVRAFFARSGILAWEHTFDFHTSSAPTIAGDRIYFGLDGSDGKAYATESAVSPKLVCLGAADGRTLWETPIEGKVLSAPVIAGKWIVFGTDQHIFYVLEEVF